MFGRPKDTGENRIRKIEALTSFAWEVIDLYHQGVGPGAHEPMSPSLAKAMIADEINRQLGEESLGGDWRHARLRIAGSDQTTIMEKLSDLTDGRVVTARCVGARDEEDELVLYATVKCSSIQELTKIIHGLEGSAFEVRDWTFGLFVR